MFVLFEKKCYCLSAVKVPLVTTVPVVVVKLKVPTIFGLAAVMVISPFWENPIGVVLENNISASLPLSLRLYVPMP